MGVRKILLFVVGRVLATLGVGFGVAFDYVGGSWLNLSSDNWGVIATVSFVVFLVLTVAREVDLALQQKPNIAVKPEVHNDRATLLVTNIGGGAIFTAKARVRATAPEPELYSMCWEAEPTTTCHIDGDGGTASILIAEKAKFNHMDKTAIDQSSDYSTSFLKGDLLLCKMGVSGRQTFPTFSGKTSKKIRDDREITSGTLIKRCIVEVAITATPTLRKNWGARKYLCEIENGELKLYETELSTPQVILP